MKRRKPRPGVLPKADKSVATKQSDPTTPQFDPATAIPHWLTQEDVRKDRLEREEKERDRVFTALAVARKKAEELAGEAQGVAFSDWIHRCVVLAQQPSEWTQARVLYESYLAHAKTYGRNRTQKALSIQELATETQWGRMMATRFPKKRRTAGWYYQLRCKRGGQN